MTGLIGKTLLSQFRVDAFIAAGGMGAVYRVWDLKRNVPLAMKVLHGELADDPSMFKHFQREGRALQKLAHPNIVPFYGLYQTMDFAFMLERFIDGPSLKEVLKRNKGEPLPLEETLIYLKALCASLGYAHANKVVHCDVKPGNVMLDSGGNIYLADFGIARHAESSTTTMGTAGTSAYMPPEQILGEVVTPATDVYALGVILYEMITGRRPFRGGEAQTDKSGETLSARIRQEQLHSKPQDPRELAPAIPEELAKVVLTALSKKHTDRFASAPEFFDAICKAVGISPSSVKERIVLPEVSEIRDYSTGKEVIKGAAQVPNGKRIFPVRDIRIVGAAILGIFLLVVIGVSILSRDKNNPAQTSIPPTTRSLSTSTPDFAVRTAKAILTQAVDIQTENAMIPTTQPTSAPTKKPTNNPTKKPMFTLKRPAFCRSLPDRDSKDVNAFEAGTSFPILGYDPDGWWLVDIKSLYKSKLESCWIAENMGTANVAPSSVPNIDK